MNSSAHTIQQVERALRKVAQKFQVQVENLPLTDLHLQVKQESGELLVFNDDDTELTRCVVEEWIGNTDEHFYETVTPILQKCISNLKDTLENLQILKPYSFVLIDEDKETVAELYLVDNDTILLDGELMQGLENDLKAFWEELSKREE